MPNLILLQFLKDLLAYASDPANRDEAARVFNLPSPVYFPAAPELSQVTPPVLPEQTPPVMTPPVVQAPDPMFEPAPAPQAGAQDFWGGMGRDVFTSGAGDDTLDGGMGDDTLDAGAGSNYLDGGMGADTLRAADGDNEVDGGMGHDVISVGNGRNRVLGGMGDDRITAGDGGNYVDAGMGNDQVVTGRGDDTLLGGMGDDYLSAGAGHDTYVFDAAFGQDVIDNRDGNASTIDDVVFSANSGIDAEQLWFRRDGSDLVVEAVRQDGGTLGSLGSLANGINGLSFGSGDVYLGGSPASTVAGISTTPQREGQLTLRNWYGDPASRVDVFQDASGRTLQKDQVDGLVSAMAGFGGVPATLSNLSQAQRQQLDVVIAQSWAA